MFGWNGGFTSQNFNCCGESTTKQELVSVRPMLTPPEICAPPRKRELPVMSMPLKISVCSP